MEHDDLNSIISTPISPSALYLVELPDTECKIIKANGGKIYCGKYPFVQGLFRKDIEETRKFGRKFCDNVAAKMDNYGFFTSDETPEYGISYGITEKEYAYIFEQIGASSERDLVVMFAYPEREALETQVYFENLMRLTYLKHGLEAAGMNPVRMLGTKVRDL